jgi:hypothetical protein
LPSPRWRAARELLILFAHQWKTGKAPHIVFNPQVPPESYFPGAEHWACAAASPDAPPAPPYTSCLCQPPVHAIAVLRIWEVVKLRGEKAVAEARGSYRRSIPGFCSGPETAQALHKDDKGSSAFKRRGINRRGIKTLVSQLV